MNPTKRPADDNAKTCNAALRGSPWNANADRATIVSLAAAASAALMLLPSIALAQSNGAEFVSQTVEMTMIAGGKQTVSITMKNTGATTWTAKGGYSLGSQNPQDNFIWGGGRVYLRPSDSVAPQQAKTFRFTITAPRWPGPYNFQWRMLQEGVEWFGDPTTNVAMSVLPAAAANPRGHPRVRTEASSCLYGCKNPAWWDRNLIDFSTESAWSSVYHDKADAYEWFAVWFDHAYDTDYVQFIPRTLFGDTYCVPESVTIYYSAGGRWKSTGVTAKLRADLPASGYTIRIPKVETDGILVATERLRAIPSGGFFFQMAEVYAGLTSDLAVPRRMIPETPTPTAPPPATPKADHVGANSGPLTDALELRAFTLPSP